MTFRMLMGFAGFVVAALAFAEGSGNGGDVPFGEVRQVQWQRDGELIEKFVDGAIRLAAENDPLERANQCNVMAAVLAKHLRQATVNGETERTAELGDMLEEVLVKGIADNLSQARRDLPPEAPRSKEVLEIGVKVADVVKPLENILEQIPPGKLPAGDRKAVQATYETVSKAFQQVSQSSQGKGHHKGKGKGKKF